MFLFAAFGKLTSPAQFQSFLTSVGFSSQVYIDVLSYVVIALEVGVAGLLIYSRTTILGAIGAFGLVFAFTLVLMYALVRTESTTGCGCFGELVPDNSVEVSFIRNIGLLLMVSFVFHKTARQPY